MSSTQQLLLGEGAGGGAVANYIEDVFSTYLYTGTGASQTITNSIDLSTKGGLVWIKGRSGATGHRLTDTTRGVTKSLESNSTAAEATETTGLTAFGTTGFTIGADADYNTSSATYASWTFCKQPKFFDIVTYTGNGTTRNIAHNLGSTPGCIITKCTSTGGDDWATYHISLGFQEYINLNLTTQSQASATAWGNTAPTSSVFSVGTSNLTNASGRTYVAYLFAHDAGGFGLTGLDNVISCGSFTVSGGSATVNLGYEPQWVLAKSTSTTGSWFLYDTMRGFNENSYATLFPNLTNAESSASNANYRTPLATGFKFSAAADSDYIYIAIRRGPMKVPTLGTAVFGMSARTGTGANATVTNGSGVTDLAIIKNRGTFDANLFTARLLGAYYLSSSDTVAKTAAGATILQSNPWDVMSGIKVGTTSARTNASGNTFINYLFTRAPTVFDIVCFTGGAASTTVTHNLGAVPQLIMTMATSTASSVRTYSATLGATKYVVLSSDQAAITNSGAWDNTAPTSTQFSAGTFFSYTDVIAYLFATLAGVSKVGTYTGNGSTQTIDCGFGAGGARFVMLKRTDATGDWYTYDTARGMTALTDPYFLMDTNAGDVATLGSVTTVSTGFALNSSILSAINVNAGTYIFLAIA